ncbi:unnamed protein product [Microthlaspi erraticum]|uniref:FRIGIDA-like protein n=1 Tax=Microthlaspi erraticum TaxID=1685480 RepID=A0A6D2JJV3_9BRAS|nr:unnamed protein product [Microthlaspi erraticum]
MEEVKIENELNLCGMITDNLGKQLEKINSKASDILIFSLQWRDLEDHLKSARGKVEKRFREMKAKEVELERKSFALEERAKVVEAAEAQVCDLEMKADGFKRQIEEKGEELGFLRKSVEEYTAEQRSKSSQIAELVESLRKTQLELYLKAEQLAKVESALERHRVEASGEKESLDEEIERKTKVLSLILDKTTECSKLLEARSSELMKTQGDLKLKGEALGQIKIDLERHQDVLSAVLENVERSQTRRREVDEEIERKKKDLTVVFDKIVECEKLLKTRSSELIKTQGDLDLKGEQLAQIKIDLERHQGEMENLDWSQTRWKEVDEETERKKKDLTVVLDKIVECEKQLELMEKRQDSEQKLLKRLSSELVSKEKELQEMTLDLDLKRDIVISLNSDLKEISQQMESKAEELENVERQIQERSAYCDSVKSLIEEHDEELASKEKEQNEMTEAIRKLALEIVSEEKTLERAEVFVENLSRKIETEEERLERCVAEYDSKRKKLRSMNDTIRETEKELKSLLSRITERKKQVEESEMKMQEKLVREVQVKEDEVFSINKSIMECTGELESKRKQLVQVQSSITDLTAELKSKETDLNSVKKKIQDSLKDFQSQQARLKASLMEREQQLGQKEKELNAREKRIDKKDQQLKSAEQKVAECVKDCELKAKKLASFCQQSNPDQLVDLERDGSVCDEKTLQLILHGHLKKCPQIHLDVSRALKASSDPAKLVLDTIQELFSSQQRTTATNLDPNSVRRNIICLLECLMDMSSKPKTEVQGEAIKFATEWKNTTLVDAVNPVEVLGFLHFLAALSLAYSFDADKVQNLFDVVFLRKYAPSLCEALGVSALAPVNSVLSLDDKPEHQPPEAPLNNGGDSRSPDVQENIASTHLANEGALKDHEGSSASFSANEVSASLSLFQNSGRVVLDYVEDELKGADQRGELRLAEPIVKVLVPLLEALTRVESRSIDPDLHSDATKVAHRWSQAMRTSTSTISPFEAWGFLQFIVAYGLVKQTSKDEILLFVSHVAHFKQAPKFFQSLDLSYAIPNFVDELINGRHYLLAIPFIFSFNLSLKYSPLELLKKEIVNLRRSAKEKTQAKDRDAAKMRSIIELIEDFKLEIELPVDLVLKFMIPREIQNQNQRVVSSAVPTQPPQILPGFHIQASQTVIHSSYIATTHGSNPSHPTSLGASPNPQVIDLGTYQAGGSTAFQGRSSHCAGVKRPRVDPQGPRGAIRPCYNPPSGYGRF